MIESINTLEQLLKTGTEYISSISESELAIKPTVEKWSKKEIIGHLIDSAINNLQRFTEIQFENKPFSIKTYNQDELVRANAYQKARTQDLVELWNSINKRILELMINQTENTLSYQVILEKGEISDLRFLMKDYVNHLEHHLNQIMDKKL